jgi:hypothetical protein
MKRLAQNVILFITFTLSHFNQVNAKDLTNSSLKANKINSEINSVLARTEYFDKSYDDFLKKSVYKENFKNGVFIVNGDTPILNEEELRNFFFSNVKNSINESFFGVRLIASNNMDKLIIDAPDGNPYGWSANGKLDLRYCVSIAFGTRYELVKKEMERATLAWQNSGNVRFHHIEKYDVNCDENQKGVVFDVRPVHVNGNYLARAFFPRYPRDQSNVLIDESSFKLAPAGKLQLVGILRHELGHVLGFRHEHTRPSSGACFEDKNWKPLSDYDAFSVMHYPQCNGLGDWSLNLTSMDKEGTSFFYGSPTE